GVEDEQQADWRVERNSDRLQRFQGDGRNQRGQGGGCQPGGPQGNQGRQAPRPISRQGAHRVPELQQARPVPQHLPQAHVSLASGMVAVPIGAIGPMGPIRPMATATTYPLTSAAPTSG